MAKVSMHSDLWRLWGILCQTYAKKFTEYEFRKRGWPSFIPSYIIIWDVEQYAVLTYGSSPKKIGL